MRCLRTQRNAFYKDEVELTEQCLQQNITSFMVIENTLPNIKIQLFSASKMTFNILQHLLKADP
jgi:hypothetical protein